MHKDAMSDVTADFAKAQGESCESDGHVPRQRFGRGFFLIRIPSSTIPHRPRLCPGRSQTMPIVAS